MLERIVQHIEVMPKEAVVRQMTEELMEAAIAKTLPKRWSSIQERLDALVRLDGRSFQFQVVNFIMWINGIGGAGFTPTPRAQTFRDPFSIIRLLPYSRYTIKMEANIVRLLPATNGDKAITKDFAESLIRQLNPKQYTTEVYALVEGKPCRMMWVNEDGLASVQTEYNSYQVKPLRELLEA